MAKAGDIALFIGQEGIIDEGIEFVTSSKYAHSAFFISENTIVEAWYPNVRYRDMTGVKNYDVFTYSGLLTDPQIDKGVEYAKNKADMKVRYNILALLGILIEKIFHTKENLFYSNRKEICSELVSEIFGVMGVDICPNVDDASTTPADIGNWNGLVKTESH